MRRRAPTPNPHAVRASGDRWLFGYADIVTLLFACFASLYATSVAPVAAPDASVPPAPPVAAPPRPSLAAAFEEVLGREGVLPGVEMTTSARGLVISLPEAGSFPAGQAQLSAEARSVMLDLADRLRPLQNRIRVEGHTDDVPIATALFGSNWELSTARATRVVEFLIDDGGIDPARLSAAGYAEYRPRLPNAGPAARARNRRVDIVVLDSATADREEPTAVLDSGAPDR